ncbi:MAG: hypothetical protein PUC00_10640 [Clostridiales bacterium]|nr:hypothetical protein [Clostridiales bacterium]
MDEKHAQRSPEMTDQQLAQVSGGADENGEEKKRHTLMCQRCGNPFSTSDPDMTLCPSCDSVHLKIL